MPKKFRINGEIAFATAILIFVLVIIVDSIGMPEDTRRLPLMVAWITLAVTVAEIIVSIRKQLKSVLDPSKKKKIDKKVLKRLTISVAFMFALIVLWILVGFIIASLVTCIGFGLYLGAKNKLAVVITSICVTGACYLLFAYLLRVPLPKGMLFTNLL